MLADLCIAVFAAVLGWGLAWAGFFWALLTMTGHPITRNR